MMEGAAHGAAADIVVAAKLVVGLGLAAAERLRVCLPAAVQALVAVELERLRLVRSSLGFDIALMDAGLWCARCGLFVVV